MTSSLKRTIPFRQPSQLISFSYTPEHVQEFTDAALRYFVDPPLDASLAYGYERCVRKADDRGRIDSLLKAISNVKSKSEASMPEIGVVSWRGVMTKILTAPYENRDGWELNMMFVNGTLYFEEHLTEERLKEKNNMDPRQRSQTYYGYAFESYCTSESPTRNSASASSMHCGAPPGWGGDVDTNVQWCSVVRTKLGDTRMIIGGEVDCEIVVGFRTPGGVVSTVQSFKTIQLPRLVRGKPGAWDPLVCLDWGYQVLTFLKDIARGTARDPNGLPVPVWRVKFVPGSGVNVEKLDAADIEEVANGEDRVGFLPKWYWDELQQETHAAAPVEEKKASMSPMASLAIAGWNI
ncbi:hypothetical protein BDZ97DRAFT_1908669 [Flammula alnicola]|nr:hypothetical protein BDZ97DRAFT_1908669 [Flammula alnicola]